LQLDLSVFAQQQRLIADVHELASLSTLSADPHIITQMRLNIINRIVTFDMLL
jgi:hypothetical protein